MNTDSNKHPDPLRPGSPGPDHGCCREPRGKLHATNWLRDVASDRDSEIVEVMFKNTRVGFFSNPDHIPLAIGDLVVVEAAPGHDVGRVAMTGPLVRLQMKKTNPKSEPQIRKIYRIARQSDIEKFEEARSREHDTMIRSRKIAEDLQLDMKIGDVEYQGDGGKAIFYYIADERVDFRKLIRVLADTFKVRIEMKQIGARQEAGRIGGIGPCGRPLCCSSWMTHFVSVGTGAARMQDLSMNPQKLAGQCAKLKCCLNFEVDSYAESNKKLPPRDIPLETKDGLFYYFKPDILARTVTYSTDRNIPANLVTIDARRAFEIIALNKQGIKPDELAPESSSTEKPRQEYVDLVGQDSLTRFDSKKKKKRSRDQREADRPQKQKQPRQPRNSHTDKGQQAQPRQNSRSNSMPHSAERRRRQQNPRSEKPSDNDSSN